MSLWSARQMYGSRDERLKFALGNVDTSDFFIFRQCRKVDWLLLPSLGIVTFCTTNFSVTSIVWYPVHKQTWRYLAVFTSTNQSWRQLPVCVNVNKNIKVMKNSVFDFLSGNPNQHAFFLAFICEYQKTIVINCKINSDCIRNIVFIRRWGKIPCDNHINEVIIK